MTAEEIYRDRPLAEYGRIGNRPIREIQAAAMRNPLAAEMGKTICAEIVVQNGYRHANNKANRFIGYIDQERVGWLACIDATLPLEIEFAVTCERKIHNLFLAALTKIGGEG